MSTTVDDLKRWFADGVRQKATHMIVVCDTFDHEDYPVYAKGDAQCITTVDLYRKAEMQRVMEVYDLRKPMTGQFRSGGRCWEVPVS